MPAILNVAAYRFVAITDPAAVAGWLRGLCEAHALKGSVLVAAEGINLFLAGEPAQLRQMLGELVSDSRFQGLSTRFSDSQSRPFRRLRVKVKREIISFSGRTRRPEAPRAPSVSPATLRGWLRQGHDDAGRELVLLDTRNRQEVAFGSFRQAVKLPIDRFTQLPDALEAHRDAWRGKAVVSFCTGGIRCEKTAPWMAEAGYGDVLQLEGGILGYFEQVGGEAYDGGCFVFDERIVLDPRLQPMVVASAASA
ncbi:MAG: sulfurtransferase [Frankiaceae bacterium]|nr:sulfurtransferase [Arenimonas sp.]